MVAILLMYTMFAAAAVLLVYAVLPASSGNSSS